MVVDELFFFGGDGLRDGTPSRFSRKLSSAVSCRVTAFLEDLGLTLLLDLLVAAAALGLTEALGFTTFLADRPSFGLVDEVTLGDSFELLTMIILVGGSTSQRYSERLSSYTVLFR